MTRVNILHNHITQQAAEFTYLASYTCKTNHKIKLAKNIKWNPPTAHFYKLNTDGAFSANTTGIGGLIRNSNAEWILGFAGSAPHDSSIFAELYALTQGLKLAYENNIAPLEVEVDEKDLILLLHSENIAFSNLIADCRYYLGQLGNPVVKHAYREQNMVADQLAKSGYNFGNEYLPTVFENVPIFVEPTFARDKACLEGTQSGQDTTWKNYSGNINRQYSCVISCHDDNSNRMTITTVNTTNSLGLCNTTMVCDRVPVSPQPSVRGY
ncbi:putative ribonuclease h protein [Nicotiana attenuata]|uniref:Ribonuclease h protein n=1 Tax=Nicotiana attenuata TaxID=49451 RepID=A0A314LFU1_NICAT|nr:putative ribonuclease h protein [Nicotiana attenuata]